MELTTYEVVFGVVALISLALNLFLLYRDRINRQRSGDERRLHETILKGLRRSMNEAGRSLEGLKRKGANGAIVADVVGGVVNTHRIEIEEFLKGYYGIETEQPVAPRTPAELRPESLELLEGIEAITNTMVETVENAERFIFCVGGRSRNDRYLAAVRQRVLRGDVRYVRVITGDHIRHQLHEHVRDIFNHVELGYLREDKYGGVMVTQDTVILPLYSSRVPFLDKALRIVGEQPASDYRSYVLELLGTTSQDPVSLDFIFSLCTGCRGKGASQA